MTLNEPQLLSALARLHQNPDFARFRDVYIAALLNDTLQLCVDAEHPARHQGAAQVLQRIQIDLEEAEQAFYRSTNQAEIPLG